MSGGASDPCARRWNGFPIRETSGAGRPVLLLLGSGFTGGEPFDDAELEPVALLDPEY
jgi:hypothetical protein